MHNFTVEDALLFIHTPHCLLHTVKQGLSIPEEVHLNTTQIRALLMLRDFGPLSMHDLGARIGMTKGSFTQVIDGLVECGMVERNRDTRDRRSILVSITGKGQKINSILDNNFIDHLTHLFEPLSEKERTDILTALRTLKKGIEIIEEKRNHAAE